MAAPTKRIDLVELGTLSFERPDEARFRALGLARAGHAARRHGARSSQRGQRGSRGGLLDRRIEFLHIAQLVAETLEMAAGRGLLAEATELGGVLAADAAARELALILLESVVGTGLPRALIVLNSVARCAADQALGGRGARGTGPGGKAEMERSAHLHPEAAGFPVRADGRHVRPRARAFPGRALVRGAVKTFSHRLRQGDLRLLRPLRHPLAASPGFRSAATSSSWTTRTAPACRRGMRLQRMSAGRARRSVPNQATGVAGGHRGGRPDRQFPAGDRDLRRSPSPSWA